MLQFKEWNNIRIRSFVVASYLCFFLAGCVLASLNVLPGENTNIAIVTNNSLSPTPTGQINISVPNFSYIVNNVSVQTNMYGKTLVTGTANLGNTEKKDTQIVYLDHNAAIRQTGQITSVEFNIVDKSAIASYKINIWRQNGTFYNLVYQSPDLSSQLINGNNSINLTNAYAQEGDFVGESIDGTGAFTYAIYGATIGNCRYNYGTDPVSNGNNGTAYNWTASNTLVMVHPILVKMQAPESVFIGDSICAGHPGHYSFLEANNTTNLNSSCEYYFGKFTGLSYQNMGVGGQTTSQIRARFQKDVINQHPKYAVLEGGVNDVELGLASNETILENWKFMLSECINNSIQPVVILILPWTYGNVTKTAKVNYINEQLIILSIKYNATIVDARDKLGIYNQVTDKWSIKPEYNIDNTHFNAAGYSILGLEIANTMLLTQLKVGENLPVYRTYALDVQDNLTKGNIPESNNNNFKIEPSINA